MPISLGFFKGLESFRCYALHRDPWEIYQGSRQKAIRNTLRHDKMDFHSLHEYVADLSTQDVQQGCRLDKVSENLLEP